MSGVMFEVADALRSSAEVGVLQAAVLVATGWALSGVTGAAVFIGVHAYERHRKREFERRLDQRNRPYLVGGKQ